MDFSPSLIPVILYVILNILTSAVYFSDKSRARLKVSRSSENTLLFLAAVGPFGALAAMAAFRHKIRHAKFILVPFFALIHLFLLIWLWPQGAG